MGAPTYLRVFLAFARNSLVRDMTFRGNFIIESISSLSWMLMNLGFYALIFRYTDEIGRGTGWGKYEFFAFLATTLFINSLVQAFFMPNCEEFSELIRTGRLDFALVKPIDTQFLISLQKIDWSSLVNFAFGAGLLSFSLYRLTHDPENPLVIGPLQIVLYPLCDDCPVALAVIVLVAQQADLLPLLRQR